jgi:uncharacterized RDD family membrane protein YckC
MRCHSCGAITQQHSIECSECGAIQDNESLDFVGNVQTDIVKEPASPSPSHKSRPARSLIEFPGVKNSVPQWRKELGERVREVQEKRAREAMLEAAQANPGANEVESRISLLELLPRTETTPVNPIVVAALQRIERAHARPRFAGNTAVATMMAYDEQSEFGLQVATSVGDGGDNVPASEESPKSIRAERVHNLAVVPRQVTGDIPPSASDNISGGDAINAEPIAADSQEMSTPEVDFPEVEELITDGVSIPQPRIRPRRVIGDLNDPALNYLDSISVTVVDIPERRSAPIFFRFLSAILDLAVVCVLSAPVVAMVKLTELKWEDPRTLMFAAGTLIVMGFLYLTISTAFTGRTLGMKPFSLRVVDARTGLIPTGGQSAARAVLYLLSLASAGIALIYTLVNSERRAPHDRFTRTAVVRV